MNEEETRARSEELEHRTPEERLTWALDTWGSRVLFTSSFGAGSGVLLHLWSRVAKGFPVVFIDTGFLFEETLRYRDQLAARLGLEIKVVKPPHTKDAFLAAWGSQIYRENPDFCCHQNKVLPLEPLLSDVDAWVTGLRRDQGPARAATPILQRGDGGIVKVSPITTMTRDDVAAYMAKHAIPENPLKERGFRSIGCQPCTRATRAGEDERAGRWEWSSKKECGLHTNLVRRKAAS